MGSKHSDETRLKMSNQRKGRKFTEQHKTLISEATKGKNNPNFGKKHSKETKALISLSRLGKSFLSEEVKNRLSKDSGTAVKVINLTTNETTVYTSIIRAAKGMGVTHPSLSKRLKTSKGPILVKSLFKVELVNPYN